MKLIKIGSAPNNDIVINSQFVSAHHADLTLLDDGHILIEDKGSTNGTFIGAQHRKLTPGQEVQITRGSVVTLANENLPWAQVPVLKNEAGQYKAIVNIGSNYRNNVVVNSPTVSRYHATMKVDKSGKAWLTDNGSTNGTEVNGQKIAPGQPVRVKKGDNIVVGSDDITAQLAPYFGGGSAFGKNVLIAVAAILVACGIGFGIKLLMGEKLPTDAVVYVQHSFKYTISLKDNPRGIPLEFTTPVFTQSGTAFFIDKEGRMGTALHVANPWDEEFSKPVYDELNKMWEDYLIQNVPTQLTTNDEYVALKASDVGAAILQNSTSLGEVNVTLKSIHKAPVKITGATEDLYIAYPGRMYSSFDEFERASVNAVSTDPDIDVAILQLNTKKTPEKAAKCMFDIEDAYLGKLEPMKETLTTIGYPSGLYRGLDFKAQSLEPTIRETKVAKVPSRYTFELQDASTHGASGSPIFNSKNQLVGVVTSGYEGNAATSFAVQARYLKELYDKEVK